MFRHDNRSAELVFVFMVATFGTDGLESVIHKDFSNLSERQRGETLYHN